MKKTISLFLIFIVIFINSSLAYDSLLNIPLWNKEDLLETNNEIANSNFLDLESESAILMEQSSRKNFIRKKCT